MDFERMPVELLEMILSYIPCNEILQVALVNKRFNDVISSSVKLLDPVVVNWSANKACFMSQRKYRRLLLESESEGFSFNLVKFINRHCSTLTSIKIETSIFQQSDFATIPTSLSINLRELELDSTRINIVSEVKKINFSSLKLIKLWMPCCFNILPFINAVRLEKLVLPLFWSRADSNPINWSLQLADFLNNHSHITDLELGLKDQIKDPMVFEALLKLNLICLRVEGDDDHAFDNNDGPYDRDRLFHENLKVFLKTQRKCLKYINMMTIDISYDLASILLSSSYNRIEFIRCRLDWSQDLAVTNHTIEEVMMYGVDKKAEFSVCDFLRHCSAAKSVNFWSSKVSFEMAHLLAFKIEKVEKLSLFFSSIQAITFPKLKELSLKGFSNRLQMVRFVRVNPQLETIRASSEFHGDLNFNRAVGESKAKRFKVLSRGKYF